MNGISKYSIVILSVLLGLILMNSFRFNQRERDRKIQIAKLEDRIDRLSVDYEKLEVRVDRAIEKHGRLESLPLFPKSQVGNDTIGSLSIRFLSWNVESEGADPKVVASQFSEYGTFDVYALSEVLPSSFRLFRDKLGKSYQSVNSKSGHNDRLQIIYNSDKFELVRKMELDEINFEGRYRSPLLAQLKEKTMGHEFAVMVNHLARGKAEVRAWQARELRKWADKNSTVPLIALGDYNFDYTFKNRQGNEGFREMLKDAIWQWVEPEKLIDTNWYDHPARPDGKDDFPGSMLDFAFVAGPAKHWGQECRILTRENDFPDDETTSDHRPFELILQIQ